MNACQPGQVSTFVGLNQSMEHLQSWAIVAKDKYILLRIYQPLLLRDDVSQALICNRCIILFPRSLIREDGRVGGIWWGNFSVTVVNLHAGHVVRYGIVSRRTAQTSS